MRSPLVGDRIFYWQGFYLFFNILKLRIMNKTVRNAGLALLAAGALAYPAMRIYRYVKQRRQENGDGSEQNTNHKPFAQAYLGDHKPHWRMAEANGRMPH